MESPALTAARNQKIDAVLEAFVTEVEETECASIADDDPWPRRLTPEGYRFYAARAAGRLFDLLPLVDGSKSRERARTFIDALLHDRIPDGYDRSENPVWTWSKTRPLILAALHGPTRSTVLETYAAD